MSNRSAQGELDTVHGRVKEVPAQDVALPARGLVSMIWRSERSVMLMRLLEEGRVGWLREHDHSFINPITINNAFCDFVAAINLFIGKG